MSDVPLPPGRLDSLTVDGDTASARLWLGDDAHELTYSVAGARPAPGYDAFVAAAVPIAMRAASSLSVPEPVSPRLLAALPEIQSILSGWWDELGVVEIRAPAAHPEPDGDRGVASFFSGGVDSFYTVLRHADALDALVFVPEFEAGLVRDTGKRARVVSALRSMAAELELPLVEVGTNIRRSADPYIAWWKYAGTALASVALLLSPRFHRVLLPASHSYRDLYPWGTSPFLDPRWSTDEVEIVHEGAIGRPEKVAAISRSVVAMRWLRVCHSSDAYNCGRCEKCLRTMVALQLAGTLGRCATLPPRLLSPRALRLTRIVTHPQFVYARENLAAAEAHGADPALQRALRFMLMRGLWHLKIRPRLIGAWKRITRADGG